MPSPGFADLARLRHLAAIDRAIQAGRPTAAGLAAQLSVNIRTVQRYVEWLKRELHAPIVFDFDPRAPGYRYTARFSFGKQLLAWIEAP